MAALLRLLKRRAADREAEADCMLGNKAVAALSRAVDNNAAAQDEALVGLMPEGQNGPLFQIHKIQTIFGGPKPGCAGGLFLSPLDKLTKDLEQQCKTHMKHTSYA